MKFAFFQILLFAWLFAACSGPLTEGEKSETKPSITGLDNIVGNAGSTIKVFGKNLNNKIQVYVGDSQTDFLLLDASTAQFTIPQSMNGSMQEVKFVYNDEVIKTLPFVNTEAVATLPTVNLSEDGICKNIVFKTSDGVVKQGTAECSEIVTPDCITGIHQTCISSEEYPAVVTELLAPKITAGESIGDIESQSPCVEGQEAPLAVSGVPLGTVSSPNVKVVVSGLGSKRYKFKIRKPGDVSCEDPSGYSDWIAVEEPISTNVAGLPNGELELCVAAEKADGTPVAPIGVSWKKESDGPIAVAQGPIASSNQSAITLPVSGEGLAAYKFKVRKASDPACSDAAGYSAELPISTPINADLSSYAEGAVELCVIAKDVSGVWQSPDNATVSGWIIDRTPPTAALADQPAASSNQTQLDTVVAGSGVMQYRYKVRSAGDPACSVETGYSAAISAGVPITADVSSEADGTLELCVITRDTAGNWQDFASATAYSWTKDTIPATATAGSAPSGNSNASALNVTVGGTDVVAYKYKVKDSSGTACTNEEGYSSEIAAATPITNDLSNLADGAMELCILSKDSAGNWQTPANASVSSWTKDNTPPAATATGAPTGTSLTTTLNITVGGTDVQNYRYKVRAGADTACTDITAYSGALPIATLITNDISAKADGPIELCLLGQDSVGNLQLTGTPTIVSWTKDTTAPVATATNAPSGLSNATSYNITVGGTDVVAYRYRFREAADPDCSNPASYSAESPITTPITGNISSVSDDTLEICLIGKDAAGNWQGMDLANVTSLTWTKDTVAPTASISGAPTGTSNSVTLAVTIGGTQVTQYRYKMRASADAACTDLTGYSSAQAIATNITSSLSAIADGNVELCVLGIDAAGNVQDASSASTASWTKDATAPTATISGAPTGQSKDLNLAVTIAGADATHYKYKIRGSGDPACTVDSGYSAQTSVAVQIADSISSLSDGALQLCVVARDINNNWQPASAATVAAWTKDTTAPVAADLTISSAPTGTNNQLTLNVTVSGTNISHYKYKLRVPSDDACSVSTGYSSETAVSTLITNSLAALAEGVLELCVIGRDNAGNWQLESNATTRSWTKDSTAPTATVSGQPSGTSNSVSLLANIAGTEVTHYRYKLRGTVDAACSDSSSYSAETPIATQISAGLTSFSDGLIELCVVGKDAQGNWQTFASATAVSWTKDTTAPTATVGGAPSGTNNTVSPDITIAGTDVTHYKYKLRTTVSSACSVATGYSASEIPVATHITESLGAIADGALELCVIGRDAQNNWQLESAATTVTWTKHTAAPAAVLTGAPGSSSNTNLLNITVGGTLVTHYRYQVGPSASLDCTDLNAYSGQIAIASPIASDVSALSDELIKVCVIAKDSYNNWQLASSATVATWTRDTVAPTATLSGAPTGTINTTVLDITVAGTDVTHYRYKIRTTADAACSNFAAYGAETAVATHITNNISALADDAIEVCVIGRDAAGNWKSSATATSWTKDTTASVASITGALSGTSKITTMNITIAGSDIVQYRYKIRAGADAACSDSSDYSSARPIATLITDSITAKADGSIEVCVIGRDSAGNWQLESAASSATWTKDTVAPTAALTGQLTGSSNAASTTVTVAGTDVVTYKYKVRDSGGAACSDSSNYGADTSVATPIVHNISALSGALELCVVGTDSAGNTQAYASATSAPWTRDTTAPTAVINSAPTGTNNTNPLAVTISGTDVTHYKYKLRDTSSTACSDSIGYSAESPIASTISASVSSLLDGAITLCVIGRDAAGNWQAEASAVTASWTKDQTPPTATISGAPTGTNNTLAIDVTVAGADVTNYKYKLGVAASTDCSVATGYSNADVVANHIAQSISALADDSIRLCVLGADALGNWQLDANATTTTWTKDTAAPTALISDSPTGTSGAIVMNMSISGTEVTHYQYKVGLAASTTCSDTSGYSATRAIATKITDNIAGLSDGLMRVCVRGIDSATNLQDAASASTTTWTKDTSQPVGEIVSNPTGSSNTTVLDISVGGFAITDYKYKIRVPADLPCSDPTGYSGVIATGIHITDDISAKADGVIQVCVIAKNNVNVWQAESAASTVSWTKDTSAPTASATGAPSGESATDSVLVTVGGNDVASYRYKLRGSVDSACSNSSSYSTEFPVANLIGASIASFAEGLVELCIVGKDAQGNWQSFASATAVSWTKDTLAPDATFSGAPTGSSASTSLNVSVAGTGVTHYRYKVRVPASTACSDSTGYSASVAVAIPITDNISALADDTIEVCAIGRDAAANWKTFANASTVSWTKDTAAPSAIISSAPSGTNNTMLTNATVSGTGVTHYKYKVRASGDAACSVSTGYSIEYAIASPIAHDVSALTDGAIQLCVIGRDSAGNYQAESSASTASWTKDSNPPAATLSGQPTGSSLALALNVTVAGTDVTHYKAFVRGPAGLACTNPAGYGIEQPIATPITTDISGFSDDTLQICVIGRDAQGNWQLAGNATIATWTKDTTAPTATISSEPTGSSNVSSLAITVAGTGVTQYRHKIREAGDVACSDPTNYGSATAVANPIQNSLTSYSDGVLELCVIGRDSAGNWQAVASATAVSWTKDLAPPTATISAAPASTNNTTVPDITIAGTGVTHYIFKLRTTSDAACSDSSGYSAETAVATHITQDFSAMADGAIQLCVKGRDSAGNWQSVASSTSWTKDTVPPVATVSGTPSDPSNTAVLSMTVAGTDVVEYKYKIPSASVSACSSSADYSSAIPVATLITDDISAHADGSVHLCILGKDSAGNWQLEGVATTPTWTKDTTAPTATISNAPTGTNNSTTMDVTIAGTGVTHFRYKIRNAASTLTPCSDITGYISNIPIANHIVGSIASFTDGAMELCVSGRDAAGNYQALASATAVSWTKDTTAPTATASGQPTGTSSASSVTATVAGTDVTHYRYKIRAGADAACTSSSNYTSSQAIASQISQSISAFADGAVELCIVGADSSGNWQTFANATVYSWTKDSVAPTASVSGAPTGTSNTTLLDVTVAGTDVVEYRHKIRVNADSDCSVATGYGTATAVGTKITNDISALGDEAIQLCVIGKDAAGNWQSMASAATASWTKDSNPPTAVLSNVPSDAAYTNATTTLDITVSGGDATHYKYKIGLAASVNCATDGGTYQPERTIGSKLDSNIVGVPNGSIRLCVIVRDAVGNYQSLASATSATWTKTTTFLTATLSGTPSSSATSISVTVNSGTSGIIYRYKLLQSSSTTGCTDSSGYGSPVTKTTTTSPPIAESLVGIPDGPFVLCVVARTNATSAWQPFHSPTTASWRKDSNAQVQPTSMTALARVSSVNLAWNNGVGDVSGYIIVRRANSAVDTLLVPTTGTVYSVGDPMGTSTVAFVGTGNSMTDGSLTNGTTYHYKIFAYDGGGNYSAVSTTVANATPLEYAPPSLGDLLFWSNANYLGTMFTDSGCTTVIANGGTAYCMKDQFSAAGITLTQTSGTVRPTYSSTAMNGNGGLTFSTHLLKAASSSIPSGNLQHSIVYIGTFAQLSVGTGVHIGDNSGNGMIKIQASAVQLHYSFGSNDLRYNVMSTEPSLVMGTYNGVNGETANKKFYFNGSEQTVASSNGTTTNQLTLPANPGVAIGGNKDAGEDLNGTVGEVLLYNKVLSAADRRALGIYAWNKWGIAQMTLSGTYSPSGNSLSWTDGLSSSNFVIVRRQGAATDWAPTDGQTYAAGFSSGANEVVYSGAGTSFDDLSITAGLGYYYSLYAADSSNNYAPAVRKSLGPCSTTPVNVTANNLTYPIEAGCSKVSVKAWGGGGAGGQGASGSTNGAGGGGGYAATNNIVLDGGSSTMAVYVGTGGGCATSGVNGAAGTGYASGSAGTNGSSSNAPNPGSGLGGNGGSFSGSGGFSAGDGSYGGAGGSGAGVTAAKGGAGGGASAVIVVTNGVTTNVIAGGGGGGGGRQSTSATGGRGGNGCGGAGGAATANGTGNQAGAGGGGGACEGTTTTASSNQTPANSGSIPAGYAAGAAAYCTGSAGNGYVTLTFAP